MTDLLTTIPATETQGSTETIPWSVDLTALLGFGETPSLPAARLIDLATNAAYVDGLSGLPSLVSNVVTQTVTALTPGHVYELTFSFTAAAGKILSATVKLECPR